jgi:hypothetical protein
MDIFRIFIIIVVTKDLKYHGIDIKNVFIESGLEKEIYFSALLGVVMKKSRDLRVLYSLYGLKQIARDWNPFIKK